MEFVDEDHLKRTIDKIVSQVGRRIDEASPMVDAPARRLPRERGDRPGCNRRTLPH